MRRCFIGQSYTIWMDLIALRATSRIDWMDLIALRATSRIDWMDLIALRAISRQDWMDLIARGAFIDHLPLRVSPSSSHQNLSDDLHDLLS